MKCIRQKSGDRLVINDTQPPNGNDAGIPNGDAWTIATVGKCLQDTGSA